MAVFAYGEDIDLSYRRDPPEGYKNYYFAGTTIIHFKGEKARIGIFVIKNVYAAMILFMKNILQGTGSSVDCLF